MLTCFSYWALSGVKAFLLNLSLFSSQKTTSVWHTKRHSVIYCLHKVALNSGRWIKICILTPSICMLALLWGNDRYPLQILINDRYPLPILINGTNIKYEKYSGESYPYNQNKHYSLIPSDIHIKSNLVNKVLFQKRTLSA